MAVAPSIQQVRYDLPAPPTPGFMDYAAQFLQSFMGAKQAKQEQKSKELMTLLPALAAQGQIQPGGPINFGGQQLGITPWASKTGASLPGYENIPGIKDYGDLNQYLLAQERANWAQGKPNYQQSMKMADDEVENDPMWFNKEFDDKLKEKRRRANLYWQGQAKPVMFQEPSTTATATSPVKAAIEKGKKTYKNLWE
jgi:hypothetical protein